MSNSKRYFQLTPEILLEYNYAGLENASNEGGNNDYIVDLYNGTNTSVSIIESKYNNSRNLYYDIYKDHYVLPTNQSESNFIQCINDTGAVWDSGLDNIKSYELYFDLDSDSEIDSSETLKTDNTDDILFDKFKFHFTSRNYMGDYEGIIISVSIYDNKKNKSTLFSYYISKTDDLTINHSPMLINQKLYTTYIGGGDNNSIEFKIPSVAGLLDSDVCYSLKGETIVRRSLAPENDIMENTPMIFSIYGVKYIKKNYSFYTYNVEKLNSIYVPIQDTYGDVYVVVEEASDGDYFEIYPKTSKGQSFSDYISSISFDHPERYIIYHDLTLTEHYTNNLNNIENKVTHREQYIVNAALQDDDGYIEVDEDSLEDHMIYRPVIVNSGKIVTFTLRDQMKILNTYDNTTIIKESSLEYGLKSSENPKKYGKNMNKIDLGSKPSQVNVYNKRPDIDTDSIKLTNGGSNVTIENHQHSITSFIESVNIGVSIEQITLEDISN